MSRFPSQRTAGLLVLVAGMVVVYTVTTGPTEVVPVPEPVPVVLSDTPTSLPAGPALDGVSPEVQRVLFANGNAETVGPDQLTELPPEVTRVLLHYGATLTIATDRGAEE